MHVDDEEARPADAEQAQVSLEQEYAALLRLHVLMNRLLGAADVPSALYEVLDAAIELQRADFGHIHVLDPVGGNLCMAAQRGLPRPYLERFAEVGADHSSACGRALRAGRRIIIEDVERDDAYEPLRRIAAETGYRAVHSTPLTARSGRLLGVLSLHFKRPHRPSASVLRALDLYARQAADVIERLHAEQALRDAHEGNKRFVAMLAHELRGPLAAANNAVHLLSGTATTPSVRDAAVGIMRRQLDQLIRLVEDLFDLARMGQDKLSLRRERLPMKQVLEMALDVSRPAIEHAGLDLHVRIEPPDLSILADAGRMAQVVSNLLNNAAKFTPTGGKVWITCHETAESVVLKVEDTGSGMHAETVACVFTAFEQAPGELDRNRGLGLGMPIAKRIVEMHGGEITAKSDGPGKGSLFKVVLPKGADAAN